MNEIQPSPVLYRISPPLTSADLNELFAAAWPDHKAGDFEPILRRSLAYVCAYQSGRLIGFVNLAWDGGIHAFLLDTLVHPDYRRQGIGSQIVIHAIAAARERGAAWLHVDFEPHLAQFYRRCGFRHTEAGLINLAKQPILEPEPAPAEPAAPAGPGPEARVSLREIDEETLRPIINLKVSAEQQNFVAPNAVSIAQAHFSDHAWFRAIYAGETPVGFLMLHDDPKEGIYFLWRFMIAAEHQGKGYGRRAIELLIDHVKTRPNAKELLLSHGVGQAGPEGFYRKLGFQHTGNKHGDELEMSLPL